jgi:Na+-driven multidrug efflux pump
MAATALVGQSLGAGNPARARAATMAATRACVVWMSAMGVLFFLFADPIMSLSAPDGADRRAIIDAGSSALMVIAFAQPLQAIGFVLSGALRGGGDTRFPMFSTGLSMWVFRIPLAYFFAITLDLGLVGVYFAMVADNLILMTLNSWRYRQGKWTASRLAMRPPAPPATRPDARPDTRETEAEAIVADG